MQSKPRDVLVAGASTQSRARRPIPYEWAVCLDRQGCMETWKTPEGLKRLITWTFDQGGPVFGYMNRPSGLAKNMLGPGSIVSELEVEAAVVLLQIVAPFLTTEDPLVRWLANGSDACDMAVRVARAVTGKPVIVSIGYHGSSAIFATPPQNAGIPQILTSLTTHVAFGDEAGLRAAFQDPRGIAGVIVEVPSTDEKAVDFLGLIRQATGQTGSLFILDDIVTGFRLALGGASEYYGVKPDLVCYGKAMSNGRGISALVGPAEMMRWAEDRVFFSNTFNGDPFNCAEVIETLTYLEKHPEVYSHLWNMGGEFKTRMNAIGVPVIGHAPRSAIVFPDEKLKAEFSRRMILRGIVMDRPNYMSTAHHEAHLTQSVEAAEEVMCSLRADGLC
jgi:glutamate-1-semialdehyde 2,1-aminomutase